MFGVALRSAVDLAPRPRPLLYTYCSMFMTLVKCTHSSFSAATACPSRNFVLPLTISSCPRPSPASFVTLRPSGAGNPYSLCSSSYFSLAFTSRMMRATAPRRVPRNAVITFAPPGKYFLAPTEYTRRGPVRMNVGGGLRCAPYRCRKDLLLER